MKAGLYGAKHPYFWLAATLVMWPTANNRIGAPPQIAKQRAQQH
jgi:hypothetical protein